MYRLIKLFVCVLICFFLVSTGFSKEKAWRVRGGVQKAFKDSKNRVWEAGQTEYKANQWGGWFEEKPQTAIVENLTKEAEKKAKQAGYDNELFHSVCWSSFPKTVKLDLNTGNGTFQVTYMVGEHWSPNNRGFDIFIEDKNVQPLYVTPGQDEIDIKVYEDVEVKDKVMNFHFAGNAKTGKGDLNAMYSAIEVIPSLPVDPKQKLTSQWSKIKKNRI
ncbi:hypothetical protein MK131_17825 [Candidatus Poribacteria bacterium]|nr:hypothetical protein [Candidatus Poribacteria bacterium]